MMDAQNRRPSRGRLVVLGLTLLLAAIVYLDRVCISTSSSTIQKELGLNDAQMSCVFSAFTLAYAIFEVPSGWLVDRYGARVMLTRIVVAWSVMTAATGWAWSFGSLLLFRFLFGVGEAGAFPSIARAYGRWLPARDRGRAFGLAVMAGLLGAAATQPMVVKLLGFLSWRAIFPLFGVVGLVWAVVWVVWFRDEPHQRAGVNSAELELIGQEPEVRPPALNWGAVVRSRSLWALCFMYLGAIYGWYFYLTWLPQYLQRARGFDLEAAGWLAAAPLVGIATGVVSGGWLSDALRVRVGQRWGRRLPGLIGLPLAAVLIIVGAEVSAPRWSVVALSFAAACSALAVAPAWAACLDIGRRGAGVVSGAMNTFGNLGGTLSPLVFGWCLTHWHSWHAPLASMAGFYAAAAACWLLIDATEVIPES